MNESFRGDLKHSCSLGRKREETSDVVIAKKVWSGNLMILDNHIMMQDLARKLGLADQVVHSMYLDKSFSVMGISFVAKEDLKESHRGIGATCKDYSEYLPLSFLALYVLNISPQAVRDRIQFGLNIGKPMFKAKQHSNRWFIKIPKDLQEKFRSGDIPVAVRNIRTFSDYSSIKDYCIWGDLIVAFY